LIVREAAGLPGNRGRGFFHEKPFSIILIYRIPHSPVPNPGLSKANFRETLIYLFPPMIHITIQGKGASANPSDKDGRGAWEWGNAAFFFIKNFWHKCLARRSGR
jgi:hypothetical protein